MESRHAKVKRAKWPLAFMERGSAADCTVERYWRQPVSIATALASRAAGVNLAGVAPGPVHERRAAAFKSAPNFSGRARDGSPVKRTLRE